MSGVSWDSVSGVATFTALTGTWSTDYPVANLGDLRNISKVARVTPASGGASFLAVLPAAATVQFIGLVNHTAGAGSIRVQLYSDAGGTVQVHDSGVMSIWPSGGLVARYRPTRPYVLPTPLGGVRACRVTLSGLPGSIDIGGLEIAKWWDLALAPGREFGFKTRATGIDLLGAGSKPSPSGSPRAMSGQISLLHIADAATRGLDFQKTQGRGKPFVYVDDYESPASWARTTMLATNVELPPSVGAVYRHDTFQFRFVENLR